MTSDLDDSKALSDPSVEPPPEPFPVRRFLLWVACGVIDLILVTAVVWWLWD